MKSFKHYSLLSHNTFGINAYCEQFIEYSNIEELKSILHEENRLKREFLHIGGGSNLLFTKDYAGSVFHSAILGKEILSDEDDCVLVRVGAGEVWDDFVAWCVENGLYGLENLSYIPGEVGASAVQNIGAYGSEAADFIEHVLTVSVDSGESRIFENSECQYAYRHSIFKAEQKGKYVVTHVDFRLSRTFHANLSYAALKRELEHKSISEKDLTAVGLRELVVEIRKNKLPDPAILGSAGSFFMNPVISQSQANLLLDNYPNMPHYSLADGVKVPAGWLIEQCGWKGRNLGTVGVYEKQALVLVNLGNATGADVCLLSKTIQNDVKEKFGIEIYPEVNFI